MVEYSFWNFVEWWIKEMPEFFFNVGIFLFTDLKVALQNAPLFDLLGPLWNIVPDGFSMMSFFTITGFTLIIGWKLIQLVIPD